MVYVPVYYVPCVQIYIARTLHHYNVVVGIYYFVPLLVPSHYL